ncbi:class F sortase [Nakamurella sp. GG22]
MVGAALPIPQGRPPPTVVPAQRLLRPRTALVPLGLQDDGTMEVPPDAASLGWFTGAPTPGELGPAVIVGHVDWAGELGSFYNLGELKPGDGITVTRADGSDARFTVTKRGQYSKDEFPTDAVYANTDHAALRLITCGGKFDRETGNYLDNIIVFADLVRPSQ